jgi:uncharacterized protein YbdZ (MbtH family)
MNRQDHDEEDTTIYKVLVNHEEQYSIWPEYKENPPGWRDVGKVDTKAECLAFIKEVWTDMRPLSLRKRMEELAKNPPPPPVSPAPAQSESLVDHLCRGEHPVVVSIRPQPTARLFHEAIDHGYAHVRFTDTQGGSELKLRLDKKACDFSKANFEEGTGSVHLLGTLTLDFVKVRCVCDIDLATMAGKGHLEKVDAQEA